MRRTGRVTIGGAGLAAIAVVVLLASGCGYGGVATAGDHPDVQNGQTLFSSTCGACHTLQAAGTSGTVGPNLDNAFAGDRMQGYADSSIENVVLDQIRQGSGPIATYTNAEHGVKGLTPQTQMPANLVTGQNAIDVAAYVASVAGTGGYTTPVNLATLTSGSSIFKGAGCTGCHTLKAAGSTGTIGPNLDQLASALTLSIVVKQVTDGGAIMPAFKGRLSAAQIQAVAQYVISVAGK
ncbi:MAG TPA: c-type cytochrome [Gaiellaceae bacterium]|nr:c-type cytochrome [Gaiellaceae bacterium]